MELDELITVLRAQQMRRIESTYLGYKAVAYTIKYKNQTIYRIDLHLTNQTTLSDLK